MTANSSAELALEITHEFDAPRSLVFAAWTKAEHCVHWFGPRDFTVPFCEVDFRVGGAYRAQIRSPEGLDYVFKGTYREIVEPERLVFSFVWEEEGERGQDTLVTVTFAEQRGKTKLTFRQAPFQSERERDGHTQGWSECLERLSAYLAKPR